MSSSLRASDFAGRFGGEEFRILLPGTTVSVAFLVAERICHTMTGVERLITASIGVARLPEHSGNGDGLMREADRALYAASVGGRNQAVAAVAHALPPALASPIRTDDTRPG